MHLYFCDSQANLKHKGLMWNSLENLELLIFEAVSRTVSAAERFPTARYARWDCDFLAETVFTDGYYMTQDGVKSKKS